MDTHLSPLPPLRQGSCVALLAPSGPLAEQALSAQRAAEATGAPCRNPRCITVAEEELVPLYVPDAHGVPRCVYCEQKMP